MTQINKQSPEYQACLVREKKNLFWAPIIGLALTIILIIIATIASLIIPVILVYGFGFGPLPGFTPSNTQNDYVAHYFFAELVIIVVTIFIAMFTYGTIDWYRRIPMTARENCRKYQNQPSEEFEKLVAAEQRRLFWKPIIYIGVIVLCLTGGVIPAIILSDPTGVPGAMIYVTEIALGILFLAFVGWYTSLSKQADEICTKKAEQKIAKAQAQQEQAQQEPMETSEV